MTAASARLIRQALTMLACAYICYTPADAAPQSSLELGMQAYNQKHYPIAVELLKKSIAEGNKSALTWLYLAHAYSGSGDKIHATETYNWLVKAYPGTAEARQASQCLTPVAAFSPPSGGSGLPVATSQGFIDRITVYPPRAGHPAVSAATVQAVKAVVQKLPPSILKLLDKKGATITIAPNIDDKWPGSGEELKPWEKEVTLGEEGGRTYGHDIHIYERPKERGSTRLKEMRSTNEIARLLYHEIGHAIDDGLGNASSDPRFQAEMQADLNGLTNPERFRIAPYQDPGECFSEITGCLLSRQNGDIAADSFPRARAWIKNKLNL